MQSTIVHITADFPDCLAGAKTPAILNLVEAAKNFKHIVYSLNRVPGWGGVEALDFGPSRIAVAYAAPPCGVFLKSRMQRLARWILSDIQAKGHAVDAIHAHKFTIEALCGSRVADDLGVPLICTIQANTDVKVLRARRDLRRVYEKIWNEAAHIISFSPRGEQEFTAEFGRRDNFDILPCITDFGEPVSSDLVGNGRFVTVFNLNSYKLKNLGRTIRAVKALSRERPGISLDVFGGGSPSALMEISKIVRKQQAERLVRLCGPIQHSNLQATLRGYVALVLPTLRETYGMVFAEAILSGIPILQSKGWGMHGLFDDDAIGYACDPRSEADIERGLGYLVANESRLKQSISEMQSSGRLNCIQAPWIAKKYSEILQAVTNSSSEVMLRMSKQ